MAKEPARKLQEAFLHELKSKKLFVNIFLANGIKLNGRISDYDSYTIAIVGEKHKPILVYKNSIASIAPSRQESYGSSSMEIHTDSYEEEDDDEN